MSDGRSNSDTKDKPPIGALGPFIPELKTFVDSQQQINLELKTIMERTEALLKTNDTSWWLANHNHEYKKALENIAKATVALATVSSETIVTTERTISFLNQTPHPSTTPPSTMVNDTTTGSKSVVMDNNCVRDLSCRERMTIHILRHQMNCRHFQLLEV